MAQVTRYALIPTRNRPEHLRRLVTSLHRQNCDAVIIVDNGSDPPVDVASLDNLGLAFVVSIDVPDQPPNLYSMWNAGLDFADEMANRLLCCADDNRFDIAILNDDTELPEGWFDYVANALRQTEPLPAIACTDPYGQLTAPLLKQAPDGNIQTRVCPWAFVLRGEASLRADERFRWWWGDTDFDWQACQTGGVLLLPGFTTKNVCANSTTVGELARQAGRDGLEFQAKWGWKPW